MRHELAKALTISDLELIHTFLYAVKNNKTGVFTFNRLTDEQYEEVHRRLINASPKPVEKTPCKERCRELIDIAQDVTGRVINKRSRKNEDVFVRCYVASRMVEEDYTKSEIGRALGMSHSSIDFYVKKLNDILAMPLMFVKEVAQYKEFRSRL